MTDPQALTRFLEEYRIYHQNVLSPTKREIKELFKKWSDAGHWRKYTRRSERIPAPSPIQRAHTRIKRPEAVVDKIFRKRESYPDGLVLDSVRKMCDAVGGRLVVHFLANYPIVDREIRNGGLLELATHDPPVAYLSKDLFDRLGLTQIEQSTKESGYASIHYVVRLRKVSFR